MAQSHDHPHPRHLHDRKVLHGVLALNFAMFMIELWQGIQSNSSSLIADSMDFLSDSFSYLITLYVIDRALRIRAKAALLKAGLMLLLALLALIQGGHNFLVGATPHYTTMGWVAMMAFSVNMASAYLLYHSRNRDSNMQSVWLCSRNDAIANVAIIIAAYFVYATGTLWPDLIVALVIAWLEGSGAISIIKQAKRELRHDH